MSSELLNKYLKTQPSSVHSGRYTLRIDGPIKSGKTTCALTASKQCPHPSKWNAKTPVEINDILWIQTEPHALEFARVSGVTVKHVIDWSDSTLRIQELLPAIMALPQFAEELRAQGVKTVVWDTLSTTDQRLIRDITQAPGMKDMERIRSYGDVDRVHMNIFDALHGMKMNVIGLVHLVNVNFFNEEGAGKDGDAFKKQAEKQIDKLEALSVAGIRPDFRPAMRPKPAAEWGRLSNCVLAMEPSVEVVRAGVTAVKYSFTAEAGGDVAAGGRWNVKGLQDAYLRPWIEKFYGVDA